MPYEQQRNRRKRELHGEVQGVLLSSGFPEAAKLWLILNMEVRQETACGTKIGRESCRRH